MHGYIYKTTNLINGRIYIGQKKGSKFIPNYLGSGTALALAITKYGKENFKTEVLCWAESQDKLNSLEITTISKYRLTENLYNIAAGGEGGDTTSANPRKKQIVKQRAKGLRAWYASLSNDEKDQHNKKISSSKKGKSNGHIGFKHSAETIKKIAESNKKFDRSNNEQWRAAITEAGKRKRGVPLEKKYKPVIVDGVKYNSIKNAMVTLGIKHRATFYDRVKRGHIKLEYCNDF